MTCPGHRRRLRTAATLGHRIGRGGAALVEEREEPLDERVGARRPAVRTPEEVAKGVTDKRPRPVGQPTKVEISPRLLLPRPVLERVTAQAIPDGRNLEAVLAEILATAK